MRKPGTIDLCLADSGLVSLALEALLAFAVADGRITVSGDGPAASINRQARGIIKERSDAQPTTYSLDQEIAAAVDEICRIAGGTYDDPPPNRVREIFEKRGLVIALRRP